MNDSDKPQALLDRLRALAQGATPGPWEAVDGEGAANSLVDSAAGPVAWSGNHHDAAHIAATNPAVILALVEALEELRGIHERAESCSCNAYTGPCGCSSSVVNRCEDAAEALARAFDALEPEGGA